MDANHEAELRVPKPSLLVVVDLRRHRGGDLEKAARQRDGRARYRAGGGYGAAWLAGRTGRDIGTYSKYSDNQYQEDFVTDESQLLLAHSASIRPTRSIGERRVKVIELRYFGGLSVEETAEALGVSPQTVLRDWKLARAWLAVELRNSSRA